MKFYLFKSKHLNNMIPRLHIAPLFEKSLNRKYSGGKSIIDSLPIYRRSTFFNREGSRRYFP